MKTLHYFLLMTIALLFLGARCESEKNTPKPESGEPEYVDPTAGFTELGQWGSMEDMIPQEEPYSDCYYNYFCFCNASDHDILFTITDKYGYDAGYMHPGTKFSTLIANEIFGSYTEGLIESIYQLRSFDFLYDDLSLPPLFQKGKIYQSYYEFDKNDYSGTSGDERKWIKERFTDHRIRWVYIFTNDDYDNAVKVSAERTEWIDGDPSQS